ncbi:glycoside hydrolase family 55 protein [Athelia psychrophila]|uniref:Glycoside hydrolase family 55 protein n=1 Tax=Athelia psychrophila TaxID=1759441 RepID=A0A165Y9R6_9AGAM|nr:glycoside hydrolase family 55 protein [Fibularhizoctonia sp. CBS 109695]
MQLSWLTVLSLLSSGVLPTLASTFSSGVSSPTQNAHNHKNRGGITVDLNISISTGCSPPDEPFWLEKIKHQGISAFNAEPDSYQVFRNVKDFGAKGDGWTDDTAAINLAMSFGGRCGDGPASCNSSTLTPAIVYFPQGKYVVSSPIIAYYYTQIIGDAKKLPTLIASPSFAGLAVIDGDPYLPGGVNWYVNQDNFFRSVRNIVIDLRLMPPTANATGLHWQVSQATSLINVVVEMSTEPGNYHRGLFMENGSGGFMGDLVFNGGMYGIMVGNQQFTVRNITVNNASTAIYSTFTWGWTYQDVTINDCDIGFDLLTGGLTAATQTVGGEAIIDAVVSRTPIFIRSSNSSNGTLAGSLVLNNIKLIDVPIAVGVVGGDVVLRGGSKVIAAWAQGNVYHGTSGDAKFTQGRIVDFDKPLSLLDAHGKIFGKSHPQYEHHDVSQFVSVRSHGAKSDGKTDDTAAIRSILTKYACDKIIFFDAGTYIITDTITIPAGARIVGEAWSTIMASGKKFEDQANPRVAVRVGEHGSYGFAEITDMLFSTRGPAAGAIMVEWNVHEPSSHQGAAGMWDTHFRIGGADGTDLGASECPVGNLNTSCAGAFLALHLTAGSSAYLEGTWVWTADHDLDGDGVSQISVFSGRGILSQSNGPVWMIGAASEHHSLYQFNLVGAKDHYMGTVQSETPYYQPIPAPPTPFSTNASFHDPTFNNGTNAAWALNVVESLDIIVYGAGFYSFFQNYTQTCLANETCQDQIVNIDCKSSVSIYSLTTVGTTYQLSVDQKGVINQSKDVNGFASTATVWTP